MFDCIIKAVLLSMVVASISFFVSHSQLLEKFRNWMGKLGSTAPPMRSTVGSVALFFWQLITCSYCLGHWVAAALLVALPVRLFGIWGPVDYALTWLVVAWLAGLQSMAATWLWGE
jgi:hypothetical protein